tara:strand:- start:998 stop:1936 length:939 start_codon:yes stop_codon:yes gene_type:complete
MNFLETDRHWTQSVSQDIIHPLIKSLSEYINTLYYTNQLVAYALCITTLATKDSVKPLIIAITVPSLAAILFTFFIYTKKHPPKKDTYYYGFQRALFRLQLNIYGNIFSIVLISVLSSICLVLSFEALLHYYAIVTAKQLQINIAYTISSITIVTSMKLWELIANIPIIRKIKQELETPQLAEEQEAAEEPINKTQEQYKIILHCCNYFIGFITNSLTVILALASAATTTVSFTGAITILASVTTLSIITCILIYQKHQNKIENIYSTDQPDYSPNTLPSDDLIRGMGTMVADNRAKLDNIFALMQIGGLNL